MLKFDRLPVYGQSSYLAYLAKYASETIEQLSDTDLAQRPNIYFYEIGSIDVCRDTHNPDHPRLRQSLQNYVKLLGTNRRFALVLDYSYEGPAFDENGAPAFIAIHQVLAELKIPPERVFFLQHNEVLLRKDCAYHVWCRRHGVKPMHFVFAQYWLALQAAMLHERHGEPRLFNQHMDGLRRSLDPINQQKEFKYLCFNYWPRFHRVLLLLWLVEQNILSDGLVSFPGFRIDESSEDFMYHARLHINSWAIGKRLRPLLPVLDKKSPLRVDSDEKSDKALLTNQFVDVPYMRSIFSIITDTGFSNGFATQRITEKFLKSAVHMHPFLSMGEPGSLRQIRQLGFRTFEPFFDEGYDEISEPEARFDTICTQILRQARKPIPQLLKDMQTLKPILEWNANYAVYDLWRHLKNTVEANLFQALRDSIGSENIYADAATEPLIIQSAIVEDDPRQIERVTLLAAHVTSAENAVGQRYLELREQAISGNHGLLIRFKHNPIKPLDITLDVKATNIKRLLIDIKEPHADRSHCVFDTGLGIFVDCSNLDLKSTLYAMVDYLHDDWLRLTFRGTIKADHDTLDLMVLMGMPDFYYTPQGDAELALAGPFMRTVIEKVVDQAVGRISQVTIGNKQSFLFGYGLPAALRNKLRDAVLRRPFLAEIITPLYRRMRRRGFF